VQQVYDRLVKAKITALPGAMVEDSTTTQIRGAA
jgi:hypothetical protein